MLPVLSISNEMKGVTLQPNGQTNAEAETPATSFFSEGHFDKFHEKDRNQILEKILFRLPETNDLLNCRLVCHRWNSVATSLLQNKITIYFYGNQTDFGLHHQPTKYTLKKFTNVLEHSDAFPCNTFDFLSYGPGNTDLNGGLNNQIFQNFLNIHGSEIRKLTLDFRPNDCDRLSENVVIQHIRKLLLHQAKNVETLSLNFNPIIEWKKDRSSLADSNWTPLRQSDPEFEEIHSRKDLIVTEDTKLKFLQLEGEPSSKLLEVIFKLAPNLEEVAIEEGNYCYLLQPFNRLSFLKKLYFDPDFIDVLEELVEVSRRTHNNGCLQLREMLICLSSSIRHNELLDPAFQERVVNVLNALFESSWNSLETFEWDGVTFLPGLKWPLIMPKVRKIEFGNPGSISEGPLLFPGESKFSWSTTFPNLQSITFYDCQEQINLLDFINFFHFEPILTVKSIRLTWNARSVPSQQLDSIRHLFPNAKTFVTVFDD